MRGVVLIEICRQNDLAQGCLVNLKFLIAMLLLFLKYSIGELTQLEELDLCENRKLGTLPDSIGKMESLKKLDAHKCNLRCLPER